jgi:hypothetical protein
MQLAQTLASTPFTANSDNLVDALMGRLYPAMLTAHRCVVRKQIKLRADIDDWFSWFEQRPEWEMLAMPNKTLAWDAARSCVTLATFSDARHSDDDHFFPARGFASRGTGSSDVILNIQIYSKSEAAAQVTAAAGQRRCRTRQSGGSIDRVRDPFVLLYRHSDGHEFVQADPACRPRLRLPHRHPLVQLVWLERADHISGTSKRRGHRGSRRAHRVGNRNAG